MKGKSIPLPEVIFLFYSNKVVSFLYFLCIFGFVYVIESDSTCLEMVYVNHLSIGKVCVYSTVGITTVGITLGMLLFVGGLGVMFSCYDVLLCFLIYSELLFQLC